MDVYWRIQSTKTQLDVFCNSVFSIPYRIDLQWNVYYLATGSGRAQKLLNFTDCHLGKKSQCKELL